MRKLKMLLMVLIFLAVIGVLTIYICNKAIAKATEGKLFSDTNSIPYNKVGLLLGTSKYLANGSVNYYYSFRIAAAVKLINAGKIKYIIVSGDNSRQDYDEPTQMQQDLIKAGIDSSIIYLDYAGFRTFDSIVRLKEIFGQDSATVISQPFHNERAIYIASQEGITAVGFNARDVSTATGFRVQLREKLARVKVFLDYVFNKKPKFLGKKVIIP